MLFAAMLFVQPSKADNFDTYTLAGPGKTLSSTIPQSLSPQSVSGAGMIFLTNVAGIYDGYLYTLATVESGPIRYAGGQQLCRYRQQQIR